MRIMSLTAAAIALLMLAAPASAQWESFDPDTDTDATSPEAVRALHRFARCVAERRTTQVRRVLSMDYRTDDYRASLLRLAERHGSCTEVPQLRANGRLFAARLAEALLARRLEGQSLATLVAFDPARGAIAARDESEMMSLCVVRAAPDKVAALFATEPASEAEDLALRALAPHLVECLSAGVTGAFNRPAIRSYLGLAAFRLSEHNAPSEAVGQP